MQHRVVTRVSWSLGAAFVLACLLFAWAESRTARVERTAPPEALGTEATYARRCARCHELDELRHALAARRAEAEAQERLAQFLERHHTRESDDRRALAAWLLATR